MMPVDTNDTPAPHDASERSAEALRDAAGGVFFALLGLAGFLMIGEAGFGTLDAPGPGFFPRVVSSLLFGTGVLLGLRGFRRLRPGAGRLSAAPPGVVLLLGLALLFFALTVETLGLLPAGFLLVFTARLAAGDGRWGEALLLASVLSFFAGLLFVYGLELPFPLIGEWSDFLAVFGGDHA